jgi:hypothetical protein
MTNWYIRRHSLRRPNEEVIEESDSEHGGLARETNSRAMTGKATHQSHNLESAIVRERRKISERATEQQINSDGTAQQQESNITIKQ